MRRRRTTDLASKTGAAKAAQANLDRLLAMKGFAQIAAPFDGVVTKRTADIGALVNAGPASSGDPLFAVSDIHALRVYVDVPQSYSAQIVPGMTVSLTVPEYPGTSFPGQAGFDLQRHQRSRSSTLLVEFEARQFRRPAQARRLCPGQHGPAGRHAQLRLPASALMFRAGGCGSRRWARTTAS